MAISVRLQLGKSMRTIAVSITSHTRSFPVSFRDGVYIHRDSQRLPSPYRNSGQ